MVTNAPHSETKDKGNGVENESCSLPKIARRNLVTVVNEFSRPHSLLLHFLSVHPACKHGHQVSDLLGQFHSPEDGIKRATNEEEFEVRRVRRLFISGWRAAL